jgi:hypothetical protein
MIAGVEKEDNNPALEFGERHPSAVVDVERDLWRRISDLDR